MDDKFPVIGLSKRMLHLLEHGRDPKTGLTARPVELTEETRRRGGRRSRRRTARVWRPVELEQPTAD